MRDRALYRVVSEFIEASVRGAKAVVGRCLPPINPTDPERFHMYVHNSIFFSLALDGDFAVLQQMREKELQAQAEAQAQGENKGKEGEKVEKEGGKEGEKGEKEGGKEGGKEEKKEEKKGEEGVKKEETGAGAEGGEKGGKSGEKEGEKGEGEEKAEGENGAIQEAEQATYASANNDLRGTKLINEADVPGLSTLAMAIVDYRGHRVIAQVTIFSLIFLGEI